MNFSFCVAFVCFFLRTSLFGLKSTTTLHVHVNIEYLFHKVSFAISFFSLVGFITVRLLGEFRPVTRISVTFSPTSNNSHCFPLKIEPILFEIDLIHSTHFEFNAIHFKFGLIHYKLHPIYLGFNFLKKGFCPAEGNFLKAFLISLTVLI